MEVEKLPKRHFGSKKGRLDKYLGGVKQMGRIPDVLIIIGQPNEMNAVRECQVGKQNVTILDTDCDQVFL